MSSDVYEFTAELTRYSFERFSYTVLWIPQDITEQADPTHPSRRRIVAELKGKLRRCALIPGGEGSYYMLFSKQLQKEMKVSLGSEVNVRFWLDDPNRIDIPTELESALEANERAMKEWQKLTPGKRRGLCHMVGSAKRSETRQRRAKQAIESLLPLKLNRPDKNPLPEA